MTDSAASRDGNDTGQASSGDSASLDDLRREIDAADAEMHRLLIHRGQVIEQLIAAKRLGADGKGARGAAFRPDREADMMRRIAGRHSGQLPLSIVEHIWREIIGTFTQLQAPYNVYSAAAAEPRMRDLLRYYFGFSSPLVEAESDSAAVEAAARSGADLAVVAIDRPQSEPWWRKLAHPDGPGARVIAALPFLPLDERLDLPRALVIGPANVTAPTDLYLYAAAADAETSGGETVLSRGADGSLIASELDPAEFGKAHPAAICLGSFARPLNWPD